jgi:tetratricopeptide (TPR) repeat protein
MTPLLRIELLTPESPQTDRAHVTVDLPEAKLQAEVEYLFTVSSTEVQDLQWYFETFLEFDDDPAPTLACDLESRLRTRGRELFDRVLGGNAEVRALWQAFLPHLEQARIEIAAPEGAGAAVHWEFMQAPDADQPLCLRAASFVHVPANGAPCPPIAAADGQELSVLLAIERPAGAGDVPYRSIAAGLVGSVDARRVHIDVLRPAAFDRLAEVLMAAAKAGKPYQVLHFDGHGGYGSLAPNQGPRGFLVFEDPESPEHRCRVDGSTLGALLARAGVGTLILNACRSGYVDLQAQRPASSPTRGVGVASALHSFAEDAIRAGALQVVAMRYNLYVVTAMRFVSALYAALGQGVSVGKAARAARQDLAQNPARRIRYHDAAIQDWAVPALYQADGFIDASAKDRAQEPNRTDGLSQMPSPAARHFVGREETLYRLDRCFDQSALVVLWGPAGSGKTATAREFAAWYERTGGMRGAAEFTALSAIDNGSPPPWLPLTQDAALELPAFLAAVAARQGLWVVDGLENATPDQSAQLFTVSVLAAQRGAKILVTGRDGNAWNDPRVVKIFLPPLRDDERAELANVLLAPGAPCDAAELRALLAFSLGNPGVLQALLPLVMSGVQVADVAAGKLNLNSAPLQSLRQWVETLRAALAPYSGGELAMLAPLALFCGGAGLPVFALVTLNNPLVQPPATPAPLVALLDKLTATGLAQDLTFGRYELHPLLPLVLSTAFDGHFPPGSTVRDRIRAAFCDALAECGSRSITAYNAGAPAALETVAWTDASLARAWQIACEAKRWSALPNLLAARCMVAFETRQDAQLERLLEEAKPVLVDSVSGGALVDREAAWELWVSFRVRLMRRQGNWRGANAELAPLIVRLRQKASSALSADPTASLSADQAAALARLATELYAQAQVSYALLDPACASLLDEVVGFARRVGNSGLASKATVFKASLSEIGTEGADTSPGWEDAMQSPDGALSGMAYMTAGERALALVKRLCDENAEGSDALMNQARALLRSARSAFKSALAVLPPQPADKLAQAYRGLASAQLKLEDWEGARTSLASALKIFDGIPDQEAAAAVREDLANLFRLIQRPDYAVQYLRPVLEYLKSCDPQRAAAFAAMYPEVGSV